MCGIFGGARELLINQPVELLKYRGPDSSGTANFCLRDGQPWIMGQTQLSIVNPHPIPLPYQYEGRSIVLNGQIYNWRELRSDLQARGFRFDHGSDIEVALKAYIHWGSDCLSRFNGMFALAIWDGNRLFLARDRLGKKPLYYLRTPQDFAFSSEIKAFAQRIYKGDPLCERLGFYFDARTPYRDVSSVLPGHFVVHTPASNRTVFTQWWTFPAETSEVSDIDAAVDEFTDLLTDACRIRTPDHTSATVFLSGGIDSSLLQAVLRAPETFTVQFDELRHVIDEESIVRRFAEELQFQANFIIPTREDLQRDLPAIAWHLEMPVGSLSPLPLFRLAQAAATAGYRVAFSGEGADELFNGYYRNQLLLAEDERLRVERKGSYGPLLGQYYGSQLTRFARMMSRGDSTVERKLKTLLKSTWELDSSFSYNIMKHEACLFLQPLIAMADRMSMAHSVEVRCPFLDHRVVEFASRLTPSLRHGAVSPGKQIVRETFRRLAAPHGNTVLSRSVKHGLPIPIDQWMTTNETFERQGWNRRVLELCVRGLATSVLRPDGLPSVADEAGRQLSW